MPRGDGTGPAGTGPGRGQGRPGGGAGVCGGRMGGTGAGPVGECVCPQCKTRSPHQPGTPCVQQKCPQCGSAMVRG